MGDENNLSSERRVRFPNKECENKKKARSGTQHGIFRGLLLSFPIVAVSCCVHIFFPHLLALPNGLVVRATGPLGMLMHQRLEDVNFASNITALHDRTVELLRTGQYWKGRKLDLDDVVPDRARDINASWLESNPDVIINNKNRPGFYLAPLLHNKDPRYPFQRIILSNGTETGVLALVAPFYATTYYRAEAARGLFWDLKRRGHVIIGLSSYQFFPQQIDNPMDSRKTVPEDWKIFEATDGWLHCFRDPETMLPAGVPRLLLSESDMQNPFYREGVPKAEEASNARKQAEAREAVAKDADRLAAGGIFPDVVKSMQAVDEGDAAVRDRASLIPGAYGPVKKKYDIIYSNHGGPWNDYNRNWTVAKPSIKRLINELNLVILVVGRNLIGPEDADLRPYIDSGRLVSLPFAPWGRFLRYVDESRALWTPNVADGSPRVLTQALSKNVPIIVNQHIAGGWKYVNNRTGVFFSDESDIVPAVRWLFSEDVQKTLAPRQFYVDNYGPLKAGLYMQAFLEIAVGEERLAKARALVSDPYYERGVFGR